MGTKRWAVGMAGILAGALLFAQTPAQSTIPPGEHRPSGIDVQPEGDGAFFKPMPVDPRILASENLWVRTLARKVADGSASMQERRAFYSLYERLYPFHAPMPSNWQIEAQTARRALKARGPKSPAAATWSLIGPSSYYTETIANSGRGTALWFDPADKNTILLGTASGGVWKTTNQGQNWTSVFDTQACLSIGAIGVDPSNKNVIYVGTGEGNWGGDNLPGVGIYKSTDGGNSWSRTDLPWVYTQPMHSVRRIAVDPRNTQRVYAAGDGGLYISTNGGATWAVTNCGATGGAPYSGNDLALDSVTPGGGQPSILYATLGYPDGSAQSNGIYRSFDAGASWQAIGQVPGAMGRCILLQAPSDPKVLYTAFQDSQTSGSQIYGTTDATASPVQWVGGAASTNFCATQCWYDITGVVDPQNPGKIFLGGVDSYVSADGGATLTKMSCWSCYSQPTQYAHADFHSMAMPDSSTLYVANDGGFFVGTVSGTTVSWSARNNALPTLQFYSISQHPTDPTKIQGGLQDNGQAYTDGTTWWMAAGGDGGDSAWDQTDPRYSYEEYVYAYIARNDNTVANPSNFQCIRNFGGCTNCQDYGCAPDSRVAFIAPFELDPNDQKVMFTGTYRIWKTLDARTTNTWNAISGDLTGTSTAYITAIHPAKNNGTSGTLYAGTLDGKVQVTTNGGATWTDRSAGLPQATVKGFATHPQDGAKVLVAFSGYGAPHIFRSTSGGAAWADITGGLPAIPFNTVALDPADPNHAYAGSDAGVYENTAVWTGGAWTDATANLPAVSVHELEYNKTNGRLRAATHGRAIWELATASCALTCTATVPATGTAGTSVAFASTATATGCTGTPSFDWNYGDGSAHGATQNASHTYATAGTYTWTLTVTQGGSTCTKSGTVTVSGGGGSKPGDCDGNGTVSIGEVQKGVNMYLGTQTVGCGADCSGDGTVSIGEVQKVVNAYLGTSQSC